MDWQAFDWGAIGGQAGLGLVLGLAVGYASKKALKVTLLLLAIVLTAGVAMAKSGFVTIHWEAIESAYTGVLNSVGGPQGAVEKVIAWFTGSIAVSGGFGLGFLLGFRMG